MKSTARMGKARMASLLDYVLSWAIEHGVELREARQWEGMQVDPDTGEVIGL